MSHKNESSCVHSLDSIDADARISQVSLEKHEIIEVVSMVLSLWAKEPQYTAGDT